MESTTASALKGEKLKDSPQWTGWIKRLQQYARNGHVWELVNPDTPQQSGRPEPLSKPTLPEYPSTDDDKVKESWRDQLDIFKLDLAAWKLQRKGLAEVNEWIMTNLDPIHRDVLLDYYTPLERLQYLQSRFARSSAYRQEQRLLSMGRPTSIGT